MSLVKQLERIKEELKKPLPEPDLSEDTMNEETQEAAVPKKKAKVAKKAVKKVAKKAAKSTKADSDSTQVKLAALAKEADITPQRARQKLREAEVERDGRWSWDVGSRPLQAARKALGL